MVRGMRFCDLATGDNRTDERGRRACSSGACATPVPKTIARRWPAAAIGARAFDVLLALVKRARVRHKHQLFEFAPGSVDQRRRPDRPDIQLRNALASELVATDSALRLTQCVVRLLVNRVIDLAQPTRTLISTSARRVAAMRKERAAAAISPMSATGHKPSLPTRSKILSRGTCEWQVSASKLTPLLVDTARSRCSVFQRQRPLET